MDSSASPQLVRAAPYFPVADLEAAVSHYRHVFGFALDYTGGDPPHFAIVSRDGHPIFLRLVDDPETIVPNEAQGGTWDVFFWVRDVQALYEELRAHDAEVVYDPVVQEQYGMREFAVRDLDGHVLGFGQPLGGAGE